jgi:serine/threonine protein kinase
MATPTSHPPEPHSGSTSAAERSTSTLPPGLQDHPDYAIKKELGRGGMGVVYLAHNRLMGRDEVLKVMGREIMERPGVLDRFLREIRAVARLHHPNIVTAYSAFRLGESIVFAMEFVEGIDLSRVVKSHGPLSAAHASLFVHQTALGLQHAHEGGTVHRDIKPANLILSRQGDRGVVKILDFGLAKASSEAKVDHGLTQAGQMLGTPDYMAPEQWVDAQTADIRADVYSLGCTLYYLLSGGPPFRGKTVYDMFQAHQSTDARPLNFVRPEVPAELAALVAKMMAKDPGHRFQTPKEVAGALKPFFKTGGVAFKSPQADVSQAGLSAVNSQPATIVQKPSMPAMSLKPAPLSSKPAANPGTSSTWESVVESPEPEPSRKPEPAVAAVRGGLPGFWRLVIAAALLGSLALAVIITITFRSGETRIPVPDDSSFQPLFNGKDLSGWKTHPDQPGQWHVVDGVLTGSGNHVSHLYTDRGDFRDFHLRAEARINGGGNSGVYFRSSFGAFLPRNAPEFPLGYEAQINSTHQDRNKTGSLLSGAGGVLVSVVPSQSFPGSWFTLEVIAKANHLIIKENGKTVVDHVDARWPTYSGHIALQHLNPSAIAEFRKIEIKELNRGGGTDSSTASVVESRAQGEAVKPPAAPAAPDRIPPAGPARRAKWIGGSLWSVENDQLLKEGLGFGFVAFGDTDWTDYDLTFEVRKSAGPDGLGAMFRASGGKAYWLWVGSYRNSKHNLGRWSRQGDREIRSTPGTIRPLVWYKVKISLRGQRIRVELDDRVILACSDTYSQKGHVELRSIDSAGRFRNIKVTAPDGTVLWKGAPDLPGKE